MLELGKALSFILSILSLYPVLVSAFFVPGTHWEERLSLSILRIALAGCMCFASGLLFCQAARNGQASGETLLHTLPVRMFFWTVAAVAILFAVSWYLEQYYVPLMWRNQPREIGSFVRLFD